LRPSRAFASFAVKIFSPDYNFAVRNFLRFVWMAVLLLIVALLSALIAMRLAIHGREVTVPDFQGKTPAEARRIADDTGLDPQIEREYYSPSVPRGRVLSQMPAAGTVVRRGWELRLALSLGPQRVAIPEVIGESQRAAAINIDQRGLELGSTATVQISGIPAGQVLAQNPPPNATDVAAPKISLLIADAPSPQAFVMPSFIGQPLGSATITLQNTGFPTPRAAMAMPTTPASPASPTAPTTSATPESSVPAMPTAGSPGPATPTSPAIPASLTASTAVPSPASIIVSQTPAPGAKVLAGSTINFVVRD
jgi:beta-lactam-binding protein with PASTA domain